MVNILACVTSNLASTGDGARVASYKRTLQIGGIPASQNAGNFRCRYSNNCGNAQVGRMTRSALPDEISPAEPATIAWWIRPTGLIRGKILCQIRNCCLLSKTNLSCTSSKNCGMDEKEFSRFSHVIFVEKGIDLLAHS
jgi:hypothetical protein